MSKRNKANGGRLIASNKKARHDYSVEDRFEAGLALEGWEVKSVRAGRVQLKESYIQIRDREAWLVGAHIAPLSSASSHVEPDPTRPRKLLMHRQEIDKLTSAVERRGYTAVPLDMHWSRGRVKIEIGTAKGKQQRDKRATERERDWQRQKHRLLKAN